MTKTHIIIGASRGIGLEFATQLLSRGDIVIATERGFLSKLRHLKESPNGNNLTILQCDVVSESSIKNFAAEVGKLTEKGGVLEGGVIDTVILNAGILEYPNSICEVSYTSFLSHLQTNTLGPLHTTSALLQLPLHIKTLLFISSDSGSAQNFLSHEDGFGAYSCSKAALNQGLRHLACELHRKFLRGEGERTVVLALHPGEVNTDMANIEVNWEVKGSIGVEESVRGCLEVLGEKVAGGVDEGGRSSGKVEGQATFWTWDGRRYPW